MDFIGWCYFIGNENWNVNMFIEIFNNCNDYFIYFLVRFEKEFNRLVNFIGLIGVDSL